MSNVQIPSLPVAISLNGTEQLEAVQNGSSVQINTAQIVSLGIGAGGQLPWAVTVGGTGASSFTQYGVVYGNGTSPLQVTAAGSAGQVFVGTASSPKWLTAGTSGYVLTSQGAGNDPVWVSLPSVETSFKTTLSGLSPSTATTGAVTLSGTLGISSGGTGITSFGTGVQTALGQNVTGSGSIVLASSPTLVTPTLGAATATSVTSGSFVANESITGSLNQGAYSYGTLPYSDVDIFASYALSVNNYNQIIVHNANSGSSASSDIIVGNNNGTATTFYGNLGMNSSGWTGTLGTASLNAPNVVYLTSTSSDLVIGTTTSNSIRFSTFGGADAMLIAPTTNLVTANNFAATVSATFNTSGNVSISPTGSGVVTISPASAGAINNMSIGATTASSGTFTFVYNANTISTNTTLTSGINALSSGPIAISAGVVVTVPTGTQWNVI